MERERERGGGREREKREKSSMPICWQYVTQWLDISPLLIYLTSVLSRSRFDLESQKRCEE